VRVGGRTCVCVRARGSHLRPSRRQCLICFTCRVSLICVTHATRVSFAALALLVSALASYSLVLSARCATLSCVISVCVVSAAWQFLLRRILLRCRCGVSISLAAYSLALSARRVTLTGVTSTCRCQCAQPHFRLIGGGRSFSTNTLTPFIPMLRADAGGTTRAAATKATAAQAAADNKTAAAAPTAAATGKNLKSERGYARSYLPMLSYKRSSEGSH
jgi:hypothetical protein